MKILWVLLFLVQKLMIGRSHQKKAISFVIRLINIHQKSKTLEIEFFKGEPKKLNGKSMKGPDLLKTLNKIGGKYGIGREIFAGDTIIGIKGRFLFESPGISILQRAHRALKKLFLLINKIILSH